MKEEVDEETKHIFKKIETEICHIFTILNAIMIIISFLKFHSKTKNLQKLNNKLILLISFDILTLLFYVLYNKNINWFLGEIFYSLCNSIEFYLFFSFIYHIFFNTDLPKIENEVEIINLKNLCLCFPLLIFSYHKFSELYSQMINIVQYIFILSGLVLLCNHLESNIKTIKANLTADDLKNKKIYYYLQFLDKLCLFGLLIYNITKFTYKSIENDLYILCLEILLIVINHSLYFCIYIIFFVIINVLDKDNNEDNNEDNNNKDNNKNNNDEIVDIIQNKNEIN